MTTSLRTLTARATAVAAFAATLSASAWAQAPIKVGVALDISGPFAGPGAEIRDGLNLAAKLLNNKLGGVPVELIQADMAGNPEPRASWWTALSSATRLILHRPRGF